MILNYSQIFPTMKSTLFTNAALAVAISFAAHRAEACGPYYDDIPTPSFIEPLADYSVYDIRQIENLEQWRALTSTDIPLEDIKKVVYKAPLKVFLDSVKAPDTPASNRFYSYLRNTHDSEAVEFLTLAKELETYRKELQSPWYYPTSREYKTETDALNSFTDRCLAYSGTRFSDRYGLQAVRALFASRQYERCIALYDSIFADVPADNLFKRMSLDYVIGCKANLDDGNNYDDYFDMTGDVLSIRDKDGLIRSMGINGNAPGWIDYIRREFDSIDSLDLWNAAKHCATNDNVTNKGDWYYILAYLAGEKFGNTHDARRYVDAALREKFAFDDFRDQARAYRLKVSGHTADMSTLLDDLRWIETKITPDSKDMHFWSRILQNAVHTEWVPALWDQGRYADMALLCNYADNIEIVKDSTGYGFWPYNEIIPFGTLPQAWKGKARTAFERHQFSNLSFRLLESLKSKDIARIKSELQQSTPLYRHLKRYSGLSTDFLNELAGTLALREGDYRMAVDYLSHVSKRYLEGMRVYDENYLSRNPFYLADDRVKYCDAAKSPIFRELALDSGRLPDSSPDNKLLFARRMIQLDNLARTSKSADVKAMAQFLYAKGHFNSFERSWALTQYWRGVYCGIYYPFILSDEDYRFFLPAGRCFRSLYDYERSDYPDYVKSLYTMRLHDIMESDASDEVKAQIAYLSYNEDKVNRYYDYTRIGNIIRTHCDGLTDWIYPGAEYFQ